MPSAHAVDAHDTAVSSEVAELSLSASGWRATPLLLSQLLQCRRGTPSAHVDADMGWPPTSLLASPVLASLLAKSFHPSALGVIATLPDQITKGRERAERQGHVCGWCATEEGQMDRAVRGEQFVAGSGVRARAHAATRSERTNQAGEERVVPVKVCVVPRLRVVCRLQ